MPFSRFWQFLEWLGWQSRGAKSFDGIFAEDGGAPDKERDGSPLVWEYSKQYRDIVSEGHQKPPPAFGSPTFVWHLGIWQKTQSDDENVRAYGSAIQGRFDEHDSHNEKFFAEVNEFIKRLQLKGRVLRQAQQGVPLEAEVKAGIKNFDEFEFKAYEHRIAALRRAALGGKLAHRFKTYQPQSLGFTLWWKDSLADGTPVVNQRSACPEFSAIRVRVQVQSHYDHVTLSFFMDAAKPFGQPQIYSTESHSKSDFGHRRARVAEYLKKLRKVSEDQIKKGFVEQDRIPERGLSQNDAQDLSRIAEFFYDGIWRDFMTSFEFSADAAESGRLLVIPDSKTTESEGEIFMDHRGLIMSVAGLSTEPNIARAKAAEYLRKTLEIPHPSDELERDANPGIGPFPVFDIDSNEPNTVLKSFWPFMRRTTPWADYRDQIGCGIADWRYLYATALGASGYFYSDEESSGRQQEVPANALPPEPEGLIDAQSPVRYLVLTKGEPHREQVGRFVERLNALGAKRLFALKNLRTIKNAGVHIRLLGSELDGILEYWGDQRKLIEDKYQWRLLKLSHPELEDKEEKAIEDLKHRARYRNETREKLRKILPFGKLVSEALNGAIPLPDLDERLQKVASAEEQELNDERVKQLSDLVKRVERRLVEIGSALDNIGNGGAGRILYVINRSKFHIDEFNRMWPTLEIGNIDGWVNYGQFVQRGVTPTFNVIRSTGDRLVSLRQRLQSITEMIQTSALIIETEATRSNTEILRRISSNMYYLAFAISPIISALILTLKNPFENFNVEAGVRLTLAASVPVIFFLMYWNQKRAADKAANAERETAHFGLLRLTKRLHDADK